MRRQSAAGGELAPSLAQIRKTQDRVDEIVAGRELQRVDAGRLERLPQLRLARRRGGSEALPEPAVVGVDEELLAGLGILDDQETEIRQLLLQRVVEADRDDIVAPRELRERLRPPGRADES